MAHGLAAASLLPEQPCLPWWCREPEATGGSLALGLLCRFEPVAGHPPQAVVLCLE